MMRDMMNGVASPWAVIRAVVGVAVAGAVFGPPVAVAQDSSALAKRVRQLEEQLVDMQVVIGTLETMKPDSVGPSYAPPSGGGFGGGSGGGFGGDVSNNARLDGVETQIQALTAQLEQLSREVRQLASDRRGGSLQPAGRTYATAPQAPVSSQNLNDSDAFGGFGSTTITSGRDDGIGGLLSGGDAKLMYEKAYSYLLQQDYGAAEASFRDFLVQHPKHELAGSAQYWLGETHYLRGEYKTAATAFLEGYEKHRQNAKAPDSLLKLAMSLERLGQRSAACSSFSELSAQFPNAPEHVRRRAQSERRRAGC
jgi:tol-pal system protein YbgF